MVVKFSYFVEWNAILENSNFFVTTYRISFSGKLLNLSMDFEVYLTVTLIRVFIDNATMSKADSIEGSFNSVPYLFDVGN